MVRAGGSPRKAPALGDQACHGLYSSAARERGRCRGGGRAGRGPLARPAGTEELIPGSHEPARGVPAEGVVSAKSWAVVVLAVIALCLVVGLALAANLDFVVIGLAILAALVATYLVGRRDNPDGDG